MVNLPLIPQESFFFLVMSDTPPSPLHSDGASRKRKKPKRDPSQFPVATSSQLQGHFVPLPPAPPPPAPTNPHPPPSIPLHTADILSALQTMKAELFAKIATQGSMIEELQRHNLALQSGSITEPAKFDFRTMNYTKENCLSQLSNYNCVTSSKITNRNTGKISINYTLNFDFDTSNSWFQDPLPEPFADSPETIGVFKHGFRRPIANRYLTFASGSSNVEDKTTHSFMTAFPIHCNDPLMQAFFESNPLVNTLPASQKKFLSIPTSVFKDAKMPCTEVPLFSISEYHSRQSLAIILSLVQLNNEFRDRAKLIMEHWNSPKRISLVDGHYVACDPADDDVRTLGETYSKELMFQEFESYRARDELLNFGFQTVMDLLKANIIASRHDGRKTVLARLNAGPNSVAYTNLLDSAYNRSTLFGPVTDSLKRSVTTERSLGKTPFFLSNKSLSPPSLLSSEAFPATAKRSLTPQPGPADKRQNFQSSLPYNSGRGRGGRQKPASNSRGSRGRGRGSTPGSKNKSRQPPKRGKR